MSPAGSATLFLPARTTTDSQTLWRAAIARGWNVERVTGWRLRPEDRPTSGPSVVYGESAFAPQWADVLGLRLDQTDPAWLTTLPLEWVHRTLRLMTAGEALGSTAPVFVKPLLAKAFTAGVIQPDTNSLVRDELADRDPDEQVLTSTVVRWAREIRCFLLNGSCVAASPYLRDGALAQHGDGTWPWLDGEQREATAFAEQVAQSHPPTAGRGVVIDVGWTNGPDHGPGWAVVEANEAWGSGLYGADGAGCLDAIAASCGVAPP